MIAQIPSPPADVQVWLASLLGAVVGWLVRHLTPRRK